MAYINRRRFLKTSSAMGFAASTGMLAALGSQAQAADATGYKALVCVFFRGGLDAADFILPKDNASHAALAALRPNLFSAYGVGSGTSSRDRDNIRRLFATNEADFGGRRFGVADEMSGLRGLFNSGKAAVVGNVGPIIMPTTRTSMDNFTTPLPDRLFSHNDQQSTWLSFATEGAQTGWGGRFLDAALQADPSSNSKFAAITTSSSDVFLAGNLARQFSAPTGTPDTAKILEQTFRLGSASNSSTAIAALRNHLKSEGVTSKNLFAQDVAAINKRGVTNIETYKAAIIGGTPTATVFPETSLGAQLRAVANTIAVRNTLSVGRQIFLVSVGGYDTHDSQNDAMPALQTDISTSITAFQDAMEGLSMDENVTLFTASDFGRTMIDNGDGTDHGWGGHHFVVGGAVAGKKIYGDLPAYDLSLQNYTASRGRLIPSVSVEQYAATLGKWFGLDPTELAAALPNLSNFTEKDLGFLGT